MGYTQRGGAGGGLGPGRGPWRGGSGQPGTPGGGNLAPGGRRRGWRHPLVGPGGRRDGRQPPAAGPGRTRRAQRPQRRRVRAGRETHGPWAGTAARGQRGPKAGGTARRTASGLGARAKSGGIPRGPGGGAAHPAGRRRAFPRERCARREGRPSAGAATCDQLRRKSYTLAAIHPRCAPRFRGGGRGFSGARFRGWRSFFLYGKKARSRAFFLCRIRAICARDDWWFGRVAIPARQSD